jgi:hypothetical protein
MAGNRLRPGALIARALGASLLLAGLVALAFNGYVEDYGAEPLRTWPVALAAVVLGAAVFVAVGGLGSPSLRWALPMIGAIAALKLVAPSLALPALALLALALVLAVRDAERGLRPAGSNRTPVPVSTARPQARSVRHERTGTRPRSDAARL